MNILAPVPARLVIEVVYDFVCPWCYLGVKRLSLLLARRRELGVEMIWRPFLLNPDMPRSGMARSDYMIRKFGAEERGGGSITRSPSWARRRGSSLISPPSAARRAASMRTG